MNKIKIVIIVLLALMLSTCVSNSGPVVIREPAKPAVKPSEVPAQAIVQPVIPDQSPKHIPLLEKLITQSTQALDNNSYEQAINLAEKGLRIQRKESRLYLLLAKAYRANDNVQQSIYFAKQGLRYVTNNNPIYDELMVLAQ